MPLLNKYILDSVPFGMEMPGRNGYAVQGGWANSNSLINGQTYPADLTINNRTNNTPAEYTAANSISFTGEYEDGSTDEYMAYILDANNASSSTCSAGSGSNTNGGYRYGFNGKEKDGDMDGNNYDYGFRIYNPGLGRFLSVDPLTKKYPELTPYQFASNTPIQAIDLDGLERYIVTITAYKSPTTGKIEVWDYKKVEVNNPHNLGTGTLIQTFTWQGSKNGVSGGSQTSAYIPEKKSLLQKTGDFFKSIFTKGDESNKERPGFVVFGQANFSDWSNGLPKASPGSETIDLGKFLTLYGGMREGVGPADLAEDFGNSAKLAHLLEQVDKVKEAYEKAESAVGESKNEKKHSNKKVQDSCERCHAVADTLDPSAHGKIDKVPTKEKE